MLKRRLLLALQLVIAVGIFALLLRRVDLVELSRQIKTLAPVWLLAAFAVLVVQVTIAALRWWQLMRMAGHPVPLRHLIGAFATGSFISSLLPGGIAGDGLRIWYATRHNVPAKTATGIIVLDRVLSLWGLGLLVILACLARLLVLPGAMPVIDITALLLGLGITGALLLLMIVQPVVQYLPAFVQRLLTPVSGLSRLLASLFKHPAQFVLLSLIIMLVHLLLVVAIICLADGMQVALSPLIAVVALPTALLLSAVPITPGGWGVREGAMVIILGQFGVAPATAFAISVLFGMLSILSNLPGAVLWLVCHLHNKRQLKQTNETLVA